MKEDPHVLDKGGTVSGEPPPMFGPHSVLGTQAEMKAALRRYEEKRGLRVTGGFGQRANQARSKRAAQQAGLTFIVEASQKNPHWTYRDVYRAALRAGYTVTLNFVLEVRKQHGLSSVRHNRGNQHLRHKR